MKRAEIANYDLIGLEKSETAPGGFDSVLYVTVDGPDVVGAEELQIPGRRLYEIVVTREMVNKWKQWLDDDWRDHCRANGITE